MAKNRQQQDEQPQYEASLLRPFIGLDCYFWQMVNGRLRGYPAKLVEKATASEAWNIHVFKFRTPCDYGGKRFADAPTPDHITFTLPSGCDDGLLPKEESQAPDLTPVLTA